jgi:hypothetical protein
MKVEVHVEGQLSYGGLPDFHEAAQRYKTYAESHGYPVPQVLLGLSGQMNTVRLVFRYDDLSQYAEQEARTLEDREYGKVAGEMGFADGTVTFAIYRQI